MKASILAWWQRLATRERKLVLLLAVLIGSSLLYSMVIAPFRDWSTQAQQSFEQERALHQWITVRANKIHQLRLESGISGSQALKPINNVVSTLANKYQIELIRMEPSDTLLKVWIEPTSYRNLMHWLNDLSRQEQIQVQAIDFSRTEQEGEVDISKLHLIRGSL